jgi:hypothetical protein
MLYKTIPIMERTDGSLQIDTNKVTLTQGDYNFNINYFTKEDYSDVSPVVNVQVSFRRKDGQQTGWLPLQHIRGNQYIINLKSSWFTNVPGNMYVTFRVFQTTSNNVNLIINTSSGTLVVNPISAFNTPEPDIIPSEFEIYMSQTNDKFKEVDEELSDLRNDLSLSQLGKGIFDTEQELLKTYPNGVDYPDGTWAVLLNTNTVWLYDNTTKTWYNSYRDVTDIFDLDDKVYRFAKQLYEDSANLFDINSLISSTSNACTSTISDGTINTIATGNWAYKLYYLSGLEIGKTYTLSFKCVKGGNSESQIFIGNEVNVDSASYGRMWINTTEKVQYATFTATTNILSITHYVSFADYTSGASITISDIMLNEGEPLPYKPYNAKMHITNSQAEFLKSEYDKGLNKFDLTNAISNDGEAYGENGETLYWGGYCRFTNYTEIKSNTNYVLSINDNINTYTTYAFYDINKNFISQTAGNGKIITPANARYLRFACQKLRAKINTIMLNDGNEALPYHPFYGDIVRNGDREQQFLKNEYENVLNLFDKNNVLLGKSLENDGTLKDQDNYFVSDFINVNGIDKLFLSGGIGENNYSFFYDSNFNAISSNIRVYDNDIINIPTNAYYYRFESLLTNLDKQITVSQKGKLIYEVDIMPVQVYENPQPNSEQGAQSLYTKNRSGYKYLIIGYKTYYTSNASIFYIKIDNANGKTGTIGLAQSIAGSSLSKSRDITLVDDTTVSIADAYENGNVANTTMVVVELLVSNY